MLNNKQCKKILVHTIKILYKEYKYQVFEILQYTTKISDNFYN